MSPSSATSPTAAAGVTWARSKDAATGGRPRPAPEHHARAGAARCSDNGSAYRSHAWRDACTQLGITHKRTRPYRPQTNGKIERFHRTLSDGWAYARLYGSETARRQALPGWLHFCNHHRAHSAIGGQPPISRLTNLPGHHT